MATPVPSSRPYVVPTTESEIRLAALWQQMFGIERVGVLDDFFELGADSLLAEELAASVEERFGVSISLGTLLRARALGELARVLDRGPLPARGAGTVVPLQLEGSATPLFCIPGAGSTSWQLLNLAAHLGSERPVYAIEPRGMHHRALPHRTVEAMARDALRGMRAVQPLGPYLLAGYSFGGAVGFEMANQLRRAGESVALLVMIDTPVHAQTAPLAPGSNLRARVERNLARGGPRGLASGLMGMTRRHFFMATAGPITYPRDVHYGAFFEIALAARRRYRPPRAYDGRVLMIRSQQSASLPADLGWGAFVSGPMVVVDVSGDHLSMLRDPHVAALADRLRSELDRVGHAPA